MDIFKILCAVSNISRQFSGSGRQESQLLTELVQSGVHVRGFMREPGSLEAVFMQLTRREEERVVLSYDADDESGL